MMDLADKNQTVQLEIIERFDHRDTDKAWYIKLPDGFYWLPKSQCRIVGKHIYIPKWLADLKGIDYLGCDVV